MCFYLCTVSVEKQKSCYSSVPYSTRTVNCHFTKASSDTLGLHILFPSGIHGFIVSEEHLYISNSRRSCSQADILSLRLK